MTFRKIFFCGLVKVALWANEDIFLRFSRFLLRARVKFRSIFPRRSIKLFEQKPFEQCAICQPDPSGEKERKKSVKNVFPSFLRHRYFVTFSAKLFFDARLFGRVGNTSLTEEARIMGERLRTRPTTPGAKGKRPPRIFFRQTTPKKSRTSLLLMDNCPQRPGSGSYSRWKDVFIPLYISTP